ncbi:fungal-specific transcription factor [Moniliophthora roreri MCA 2997]|uniref:Fungal-specific transcription factor n=1 Tax=Moniliophthora roreri (strain MCA 2997) TaxID=1381753 RepID=V2WFF4_MONRO|nr:fungal-specific transcription factor [Moniliophthora roreri MCA 2997]
MSFDVERIQDHKLCVWLQESRVIFIHAVLTNEDLCPGLPLVNACHAGSPYPTVAFEYKRRGGNVKHSRVLVACNNCRSRKVKCNRSNPHNSTSACERCLSKGLRCEYTTIEADVSNPGVDMSPVYLYPADQYNYSNATPQANPAMSTGLPAMPGPGHNQLQHYQPNFYGTQTGGVHTYPHYPSNTGRSVPSPAYASTKSGWPFGMPAQSPYHAGSRSSTNPRETELFALGDHVSVGIMLGIASSDASSFGMSDT